MCLINNDDNDDDDDDDENDDDNDDEIDDDALCLCRTLQTSRLCDSFARRTLKKLQMALIDDVRCDEQPVAD